MVSLSVSFFYFWLFKMSSFGVLGVWSLRGVWGLECVLIFQWQKPDSWHSSWCTTRLRYPVISIASVRIVVVFSGCFWNIGRIWVSTKLSNTLWGQNISVSSLSYFTRRSICKTRQVAGTIATHYLCATVDCLSWTALNAKCQLTSDVITNLPGHTCKYWLCSITLF